MSTKSSQVFLTLLVFQSIVSITHCVTITSSTKDDVEGLDPSIKCGECPCGNPCGQQQPVLSPPPPPPPPLPSPPPPPPPPPPPVVRLCNPPPPPAPRFIYVTGASSPPPPRFTYVTNPTENLYPNDPLGIDVHSNAQPNSLRTAMVVSASCLMLYVLLFW